LVFTADLPTLNGASDREKGMAMRATLVAGWIVLFGLTAAVVAEDDGSSLAVPAASDAAEVAEEPIQEPIQEPIPDPIPEPEAAEPPAPDAAAEPAPAPAPAPAAHRVTVDIGVSGELFAPTGPDAEPVRQPIAVDARFDFIERSGTGTATVVRDYAEAAATVRVADQPARVDLPADARRVEVALRGTTPAPYLGDGFLSREELDLLDTPFDAVLLDRLLPAEPVAIGAKWTVAPDAAAGLLAIDTLETGGLDAELTAVDGTTATVRLTGIIDGAADGVPTHLVVEGDCTLAAAPVDAQWRLTATRVAAVTIRERRQASHVAPGFDVEARVSVSRRPHEAQTAAAAPTAEGTGRSSRTPRPASSCDWSTAGRSSVSARSPPCPAATPSRRRRSPRSSEMSSGRWPASSAASSTPRRRPAPTACGSSAWSRRARPKSCRSAGSITC
jgi:hypothetical protein